RHPHGGRIRFAERGGDQRRGPASRDDGEVGARLKARKPPRRTAFSMFHRDGGLTGNRTRVQGFAVLCVTTPPSGRGPISRGPAIARAVSYQIGLSAATHGPISASHFFA